MSACGCIALCISIAFSHVCVLLCSSDFPSAPKCTSEKGCRDQKQCHNDGKIGTCRLIQGILELCFALQLTSFASHDAMLTFQPITPCRLKIHSCRYIFYCSGQRKQTIPSKPDWVNAEGSFIIHCYLSGLRRYDLGPFIQTHINIALQAHVFTRTHSHPYKYSLN